MRIDRLDLLNFRCFENRTFDFDERFTLLIGANATGKTAILEALGVALGAALIPIPDAWSRPIHRLDVRRTFSEAAEIGNFEEQFPTRISVDGQFGTEALSWARELRTPKSHTTHREARRVREAMAQLTIDSANNELTTFPFIGSYGTSRLWLEQRQGEAGGISPSNRTSRYAGYRHCLASRSSTHHLIRWVKRLTLIQAQRGTSLETLNATMEAVVACVEEATAAYFDFDEDDIVVAFGEKDRFPFKALSDGQRNMAAMAADIAIRCSQLNPHLNGRACLETPGVALIDEIDLHLHPRWQRSVVGQLSSTFPNLQFITTSHSPFIVQSVAQTGGVINLDAGDDGPFAPAEQSIEDIAEDIMRVQQPQRSRRFQEMIAAAEDYFGALESSSDHDSATVRSLRNRLDQLEERFASNPAYVAFLRMHRVPENNS